MESSSNTVNAAKLDGTLTRWRKLLAHEPSRASPAQEGERLPPMITDGQADGVRFICDVQLELG